jgi:hypothetical protein
MPPSGFRTRHDPLSRRRAALSWAVESCKPIGSGRKQPDQKQGSLRDDLININGIAQDLIRYRYTIPQEQSILSSRIRYLQILPDNRLQRDS